jgi:transcriptional adapter 2-beta
LLDKRSYVEF